MESFWATFWRELLSAMIAVPIALFVTWVLIYAKEGESLFSRRSGQGTHEDRQDDVE